MDDKEEDVEVRSYGVAEGNGWWKLKEDRNSSKDITPGEEAL